jgi:hypothetical protein
MSRPPLARLRAPLSSVVLRVFRGEKTRRSRRPFEARPRHPLGNVRVSEIAVNPRVAQLAEEDLRPPLARLRAPLSSVPLRVFRGEKTRRSRRPIEARPRHPLGNVRVSEIAVNPRVAQLAEEDLRPLRRDSVPLSPPCPSVFSVVKKPVVRDGPSKPDPATPSAMCASRRTL